jgi:hypothetical protein
MIVHGIFFYGLDFTGFRKRDIPAKMRVKVFGAFDFY